MSRWQRPGRCESGACAEVTWKSPCESAHCVETSEAGAHILLRSSLAPEYVAELTREEFSAFVIAIKAGEYDGYVI